MLDEREKAALVALGLREDASVTEIRAAYLEKSTHNRFHKVILADEHLEKDFVRLYRAYVTLLKYHSQSENVNDLSDYPPNQIGTFHFNQGLYFLIKQNYLKAMDKFQEAYKFNKEDELVLIYMGVLLVKRKNYYAAEKYFLDAVKLDKQNDEAWFQLGENYLRAEEYRKALNMFETAKNLNPSRTEIAHKIKELKDKLSGKARPEKQPSFLDRLFGRSGKK